MKLFLKHLLISGLSVFFVLVPQVQAEEKFTLIPFAETEYRLDSNFYKSDVDEQRVTALTFKPGFKFGYGTPRSNVSLNAFLTDTRYQGQDSDKNDYTGHNLALAAQTALFTRITTGLTDTWINTRNPSETDAFANSVSIDEYAINRFSPWLKYAITDRLAASVAYRNVDIDYANAGVEDSSENGGTLKLYYSLSKFTTLDLEYQIQAMDYNQTSSDYTSEQYSLNLESQFRYFGFTAGVGFQTRDFDDPAINDLDTSVWHIAVLGQNLPIGSNEKPRSRFKLAYAENLNTTGFNNEYYTANRITLTAGKRFMEKLDLGVTAYFQRSDYENALQDRSDDTWFFSTALDYLFKEWMILTLEAGYETRDSSLSVYDYGNRYVLCRVNLNYNLGSR